MYKVRLANGREVDARWAGASGGALTIALSEGDILDLAQTFGDPNATKVIERITDHDTMIFDNYTWLIALIDGRWQGADITITLRQGG